MKLTSFVDMPATESQSLCKIFLLSFIIPSLCHGRVHKGTAKCEKYDRSDCMSGSCETTIEECANMTTDNKVSLDDPDNYMLCYASWMQVNSSEPQVVKKGCWMNFDACYNKKECVEEKDVADVYFCCCDGDMCNKEFYHRPSGVQIVKEQEPNGVKSDEGMVRRADEQQKTKTVLYSIVPILGFGFVVVTLFFMWRRHRRHVGHTQLPTVDPGLVHTPSQTSLNVQLLELRARGRFGSVWKAQMLDQLVAVKIFPFHDKESWIAELDIYNLPRMRHENILHFIASEKKEENMCKELWLITKFHENGSLCDFLKANTVTWAQLCRVGETMACGLAYLHDELPAVYSDQAKPAIAHRDFKSKNVLLKSGLTACIADFGLALKLQGKIQNETHTLVGTRRYMAPEILEGAICFNRDSFLRIDMYACGMILWELMSRCSTVDGETIDEYRLPFETEVGLHPSLEVMQTLVVTQKCRPKIKSSWQKHQGMSGLVATIEECWDQDAEARLSAGCVQERIAHLARTVNSGNEVPPYEPPPLPPLSPLLSVINTTSYVPKPGVIDIGGTRDVSAT